MLIAPNTVVSLKYQVTDTDGRLVDPGEEPMVYLHGGFDDLFPKLEAELAGRHVGDALHLTLKAPDAFGLYDPELLRIEPRDALPGNLLVGKQYEGTPEDGTDQDTLIYTVTEVTDDHVVLDANHPLAGVDLVFDITVLAIREASEAEISQGHVL